MASPKHNLKETSTTIDDSKASLPCEKARIDDAQESCHDDLPPESFAVPKGDEKDWFHQNAIIQRKSSRKLSFSLNTNNPRPSWRRASLSPNHVIKSSVIGLPMTQKARFPDGNHRQNKVGIVYLFRSQSEPGRKQSTEPVSPQVSCLGRVGTKRERTKKTSLWTTIVAMLRTRSKPTTAVSKETVGSVELAARAPTLADLKRLRSGRRS